MSKKEFVPELKLSQQNINNLAGMKVAIVYSTFNREITEKMLKHCLQNLKKQGVLAKNIFSESVDGALEIPVVLSWCKKYYSAEVLIGIGCVIRGETYHFEVVSQTSAIALANLSLKTNTAVINGILTCENIKQAQARIIPVSQHLANCAIGLAILKNNLKAKNKINKNRIKSVKTKKNNEKTP